MTKYFKSVTPINLHLFDGAAGGDGAGAAPSGATAQSGTANVGNAQPTSGDGINAMTESDAETNERQDVVVTTDNDQRRTQYNKFKTEYKDFITEDTQRIINKRFRATKELEANAKAIAPALKALANNYGVDVSDLGKLSEAILNDQKLYEQRALENGVSVEAQMKFDKIQAENDALKAQQDMTAQEQRRQQILQRWEDEAESLKETVPEFDLDEALEDETFYDLLVRGYPMEDVYNFAFPDQFKKRMTSKIEKQVTDNIRSRGMRPKENSVSSGVPEQQRFDASKLTPAQIRELENRVFNGERIVLK